MSYYYKLFWLLTTVTTFLRLSVIGKLGLTVDEAHYWVYSKFLDLSYYDHPPMIGYIIKLFTDIFGINEFAVRLPSVIIFILTSWIFFLCVRKIFNEKINTIVGKKNTLICRSLSLGDVNQKPEGKEVQVI